MRVYKVYGKYESGVSGSVRYSGGKIIQDGFVYTNPSSICEEYFYNTDDRIIELVKKFGIHTTLTEPFIYIDIDRDFSSKHLPSGPLSMKIVRDIKNEIRDERINELLGIKEYYNG